MLTYPNIDPIAFQLGPIAIRWYGLAYATGLIAAFRFLKTDLETRLNLSQDHIMNLMLAFVLGIIIGGRLGYVLIYDFAYFAEHPADIIAIWKGGLAYHGGALGAVIGMYVCSRLYTIKFLDLLDLLGIGSTIGIFFGRIANFINGELYGRVTDSPLGMIFPGGGNLPRHPSQLYECFFEGLLLFLILWWCKSKLSLKRGQLFSLYLLLYGIFRTGIEVFREPDAQLGYFWGVLTMGQLLSGIMIVSGFVLFLLFSRQK